MNAPSPKALEIFSAALTSGIEVSLTGLIDDLGISGMALDQLTKLSQVLESWQMELAPPITAGGFDTPRVMSSKRKKIYTEETFRAEIMNGESSAVEFKSSLLYDHKKAKAVSPETPPKDLRSDAVLFSSLKTIAAFMNCGGGLLFEGIDNEARPKGLAYDCMVIGCVAFDADRWELELRNHITGKFKDGTSLNDYAAVDFVGMNGLDVARLLIRGRRNLVFLKYEGRLRLFRRQGNRSIEVMIDEVEEFIETRKRQGWVM